MTRFQRRMMAIVIHTLAEELQGKDQNLEIYNRYVEVYDDAREKLMDVKVEIFKKDEIVLVDMYSDFKFFSEVMGDYIRFKSEDEESKRLHLLDLSRSLMRGKDGSDNHFKASIEGYRKIRIEDDEVRRPTVYVLSW